MAHRRKNIEMIRRLICLLCLCSGIALAQQNLAGDWVIINDIYGNPLSRKLVLKIDGGKLTGTLAGEELQGTLTGNSLRFTTKDKKGVTGEFTGSISGETISGNSVLLDPEDPKDRTESAFTARRIPQPRAGGPQRHEFVPTTFYREFSAFNKPVLTIWPKDTVHTNTVDAGGTDEKGVTRVLGGNPQTGPFYIETAIPGDTLVVHLNRVRLNRDWAISDDAIVERGLGSDLAVKMKDGGKSVRWLLDRQRMVARPEKPGEHMANYTAPVRPMLGCVGVAPGFGAAPIRTGDSGRFGGNMDFNEIVEGTTVYLPVMQPGALLYVGDGHALQGDGELNGNALETSMDVEFTVDVIHDRRINTPRVESSTHLMAVGLGGSIDDSFRFATGGLAQWLEQDYKLTPSEIAQVLGTSAEYVISEVADRNAGVVAKIRKERLAGLTPGK
jgi:acetamidase/formamidase